VFLFAESVAIRYLEIFASTSQARKVIIVIFLSHPILWKQSNRHVCRPVEHFCMISCPKTKKTHLLETSSLYITSASQRTSSTGTNPGTLHLHDLQRFWWLLRPTNRFRHFSSDGLLKCNDGSARQWDNSVEIGER
jgi:hypothetical protein